MEKKNLNGQNSAATSALRFQYSDGNFGLFNSWDALLDFWAPYYDGKSGADRHFRKTAYGAAVTKDGTEIMVAPVSGPLTTSQKKDLMTRAYEYVTGINA